MKIYKALFLLLVISFSCSKSTKDTVSDQGLDSLKLYFQFLESELENTWSVMIDDDDEMLFEMKRLLDEVSYTGAYNVKQYNQLQEEVDDLKALRYNQKTMSDSDLIDEYDSVSTRVISEVIEFAQHHPEYESYPLMDELVNDIMEAQHQVFFYRVSYDKIAFEYNNFIEQNEGVMDQITNKKVQDIPVFAITD